MPTSQFDVLLPDLAGPAIEVVTSAGTVDLHNFADFLGYEYCVGGNLRLRWKLDDANSLLAGRRISHVTLTFGGVSQVSISPRDPDMPLSEDSTLEHYQLVERDGAAMRFSFEFVGGTIIDVTASSIALSAETL